MMSDKQLRLYDTGVIKLVADLLQRIDNLNPEVGRGPIRAYYIEQAMTRIKEADPFL